MTSGKNEKIAVVISGGPSVGKTTIIDALEKLNHPVLHEISTAMIKEGVLSPQLQRDAFQKELLRRQLAGEARLLKLKKLCFLDRGLLDGMAYYELDGMAVPPVFDTLDISHYALVLLLEELPVFDYNRVRFEDLEFTKRITPVIEGYYKSRGIPVVRIPAVPVEERVQIVLSETRKYCG